MKLDDPEWDADPAEIIADAPGPKGTPKPKTDGLEHDPEAKPKGDGEGVARPEKVEIELVKGHVINIAVIKFWGLDDKPMSVENFIERMFGERPACSKMKANCETCRANPTPGKPCWNACQSAVMTPWR
jgi:type I restriction enzyme, R subunit